MTDLEPGSDPGPLIAGRLVRCFNIGIILLAMKAMDFAKGNRGKTTLQSLERRVGAIEQEQL